MMNIRGSQMEVSLWFNGHERIEIGLTQGGMLEVLSKSPNGPTNAARFNEPFKIEADSY